MIHRVIRAAALAVALALAASGVVGAATPSHHDSVLAGSCCSVTAVDTGPTPLP